MKYTIFGFSQERAISLGLDDRDLMILRWFVDYSDTSKMISRIVDGEVYYWVKYEGIVESFPITKWKKDTVYRRLSNMVKVGVLKHKTIKEAGVWSYYKKGDKYGELIDTEYYSKTEINSSEKNPKQLERTPKQMEQMPSQTEQNSEQNINPLYSSINDSSIKKNGTNKEISKLCKDVIEYLNEKAGTKYRYNSDKTKELIKARVNEGYEYYDFTTVIDIKCAEWLNTNMSKYLRPITLFSNKFESYLNQGTPKNNNQLNKDILSKMDF